MSPTTPTARTRTTRGTDQAPAGEQRPAETRLATLSLVATRHNAHTEHRISRANRGTDRHFCVRDSDRNGHSVRVLGLCGARIQVWGWHPRLSLSYERTRTSRIRSSVAATRRC